MKNPPSVDDFETIMSIRLDLLAGAEWEDYYHTMSPWLLSPSASNRVRTMERLCMAVFSAEHSSIAKARREGRTLPFSPDKRLEWLFGKLNNAHAQFDDTIPAFLSNLRYHGYNEPYQLPLIVWLRELHDEPPVNVRQDIISGTIILLNQYDEDNGEEVKHLIGLLDDPSDYVRACAAYKLSGTDSEHLGAIESFALIKEREIQRPGIAGPFWSEWTYMQEHVPVDAIEWMMEILENRNGSEPEEMPFNGIDFYLHEICDYSPETVRRMIKGGYLELAIETATETSDLVSGMEPVLRELADHSDYMVHYRAQIHLAYYYRFFHPDAAKGTIVHLPNWLEKCETFCFYRGTEKTIVSTIVMYPEDVLDHFDDEQAWSLIEKLMPADMRGQLVDCFSGRIEEEPAKPLVLGNRIMRRYDRGPSVQLSGDVTKKTWLRIEINGGQLGRLWSPI